MVSRIKTWLAVAFWISVAFVGCSVLGRAAGLNGETVEEVCERRVSSERQLVAMELQGLRETPSWASIADLMALPDDAMVRGCLLAETRRVGNSSTSDIPDEPGFCRFDARLC